MEIAGKVAVVTGAASGIGRAVALALAGAGADLVLADRNEAGLAEVAERAGRLGRRSLAVRCDVSDPGAVEALAERAFAEMGRVEILVNNAGIGCGGPAHRVPLEHWRAVVGTNLLGAIHGVHAFVPRMIAAGRGGQVVAVSSASGLGVAFPLMAPYAVAKQGLTALFEILRMELAPHRIGVTLVCPGLVDTGLAASQLATDWGTRPDLMKRKGMPPERVARAVLRAIRRNRLYVVMPFAMRLLWLAKRLFPAEFNRLAGLYGRTDRYRYGMNVDLRDRSEREAGAGRGG